MRGFYQLIFFIITLWMMTGICFVANGETSNLLFEIKKEVELESLRQFLVNSAKVEITKERVQYFKKAMDALKPYEKTSEFESLINEYPAQFIKYINKMFRTSHDRSHGMRPLFYLVKNGNRKTIRLATEWANDFLAESVDESEKGLYADAKAKLRQISYLSNQGSVDLEDCYMKKIVGFLNGFPDLYQSLEKDIIREVGNNYNSFRKRVLKELIRINEGQEKSNRIIKEAEEKSVDNIISMFEKFVKKDSLSEMDRYHYEDYHERSISHEFKILFKHLKSKKVLNFVQTYMEDIKSLSEDSRWFTVFLLAYNSGVEKLKRRSLEIVRDCILGENQMFNSIDKKILTRRWGRHYHDDDEGMYGLVETYQMMGLKYYQTPLNVKTSAERFSYFIQIFKNGLGSRYEKDDLKESIKNIIFSFWNDLEINEITVIDQAITLLQRPENDWERISAEAFLKGKISDTRMNDVKAGIERLGRENIIKKLEELISKKDNYFHEGTFLAIMYFAESPEMKGWLLNYFSRDHDFNERKNVYFLIAAFVSGDPLLHETALDIIANFLQTKKDDKERERWIQDNFNTVRNFFQQSNVLFTAMNKKIEHIQDAMVLFLSSQCNENVLKTQISQHHRGHDQVVGRVFGRCMERQEITNIIKDFILKQHYHYLITIENLVKRVKDESGADIRPVNRNEEEQTNQIFSDIYNKKVEQFLIRTLPFLAGYIELGSTMIKALSSENVEVKKTAMNVIDDVMNGDNDAFNRVSGKKLKARSSRELFYFSKILGEWMNDEISKERTVKVLVEIGFTYENIKQFVEEMANNYSEYNSPESENEERSLGDLARFYIKEVKGVDYFDELISNYQNKRSYVFVNGGYDHTSNDQWHETAMMAFDKFLFHGTAILLNAGGVGTSLALINDQGHHIMDTDEFVKIGQSEYPKEVVSATLENYNKVVDELAAKKLEKVSFVYYGHGSLFRGVELWGGDQEDNHISIVEQRAALEKFAPETMVQSYFGVCFAGSNLVSHFRKHPSTTANLVSFIEFHYLENQCGLAQGMDNEVSYSFATAKNLKKNKWTKIFEKNSEISLFEMKKELLRSYIKTTAVLTSDYFIDDIAKIICNENKLMKKYEKGEQDFVSNQNKDSPFYLDMLIYESLKDSLSVVARDAWDNVVQHACSDQHLEKMNSFRKEYDNFGDMYFNKFRSLENIVVKQYLKKERPEIFAEYQAYIKSEIKRAEVVTSNREISEEDSRKLSGLKVLLPFDYNRISASLSKNKKYTHLFNEMVDKIVMSDKEVIVADGEVVGKDVLHCGKSAKEIANSKGFVFTMDDIEYMRKKLNIKNGNNNHGHNNNNSNHVTTLKNSSLVSLGDVQRRRRDYIEKYRKIIRPVVEIIINDPAMVQLKKLYQSISICENTPFN